MAKTDVLDILRARKTSPLEFNFDSLWIPPIYQYLTVDDIERLRTIATSIRLSSKINQKYKMIDDIMRFRGFKRFSAGTNRVVYSFTEDDRFLVKIAVDKVGMQDNPMEYKNQFLLKPYVTKMFYTSPCGTIGFVERVLPVKNKSEFKEIATDVFDILVNKILGKYVVEDVGTKFFMNWGIRIGMGPVLLDYPYIYKLDGQKLFCTKTDPSTGIQCNGEIDYNAGFNHLTCTKCGKIYLASDLRDNSIDNKIVIKGGNQMKILLKEGDTVVASTIPTAEIIERPKKKQFKTIPGLTIALNDGEGNITKIGCENKLVKAEIEQSHEIVKKMESIPVTLINPDDNDEIDDEEDSEGVVESKLPDGVVINDDYSITVNDNMKFVLPQPAKDEEPEGLTVNEDASPVINQEDIIVHPSEDQPTEQEEPDSTDTKEEPEAIPEDPKPASRSRDDKGRFIPSAVSSTPKNKKKTTRSKSSFIPTDNN